METSRVYTGPLDQSDPLMSLMQAPSDLSRLPWDGYGIATAKREGYATIHAIARLYRSKWEPPVKLLRRSLLARLILTFFLLGIISSTLVGMFVFLSARTVIRDNMFERLEATADSKEQLLDRWIQDQYRDVIFLASLPTIVEQAPTVFESEDQSSEAYQDVYANLSEYLLLVFYQRPYLQEIFLIPPDEGVVALSTQKPNEGSPVEDQPYYTLGMNDPTIQTVYPDPQTGAPTLTIAAPVQNAEGSVGVLAAHLNLTQMDSIVFERAGLGETGETYLVDTFNTIVSGRRFGTDEFPQDVTSFGIEQALAGESGSALYQNHRGERVLGVYRWLEDSQLILMAEISQRETFQPARRMLVTSLFIGLTSAAVVAAGVFLIGQQIAEPIRALARAAEAIQERRFEPDMVQGISRREDEIGTLAAGFSRMANDLNSQMQILEQRVRERTRRLERRSAQLASCLLYTS
ncbi:MAG: HAMP domain-containing protein, partial [Chloroflexi bacterium]|nr:HAMP domain-containing protein [Chloroflexota bacterium]